MVMAIKYNTDPSLPADIDTLYQCTLTADGKFNIPNPTSNIYVAGQPIGWTCQYTAPNIYKLIHCLNTPHVVFQIMLRELTYKYDVTEIEPNHITIATFNADGEPAPVEWKYQLRKQNVVYT